MCCKKSEQVSLAALILAPAPHWRTVDRTDWREDGATGDRPGGWLVGLSGCCCGCAGVVCASVVLGSPGLFLKKLHNPFPPSQKVKTHTRSQHGSSRSSRSFSVVFSDLYLVRCARTRPRCSRPADRVILLIPRRANSGLGIEHLIHFQQNCPCPNQTARALKQSN